MKSAWRSLEEVRGLAAVAAEWRRHTGPDFDVFKAGFLQKSGRIARSFPCPHKAGCTHDVHPRGAGFVGVYKDDEGTGCDDILLTKEDVEVWEVNLARLGRAITQALKCDAKDAKLGLERTRQIASLGDAPVPILLTVQHDGDGFAEVVAQLVARFPNGFILLAPTNRFCTAPAIELLARVSAAFFSLESCATLLASGKLHAPRSGAELFAAYLPEKRGTSKESGGKGVFEFLKKRATFYLFASSAEKAGQAAGSVFYKVEGETLAKKLCGLFRGEYGGGKGETDFRYVAAEGIPEDQQVLLDETLGWLEVYGDPDPGVYDAEPSKEMMVLAQYGVRARTWEEPLRRKIGGSGASEGIPEVDAGLELPEIPAEELRNGKLQVLMLYAQGYYRMLESVIPLAGLHGLADIELNDSYLSMVQGVRNILKDEGHKDFPMKFEPAFPNLLPGNIQGAQWEGLVQRGVEDFFGKVQEYVRAKGIYMPEDGTHARTLMLLVEPAVRTAVDRALAYSELVLGRCLDVVGAPHSGVEEKPCGPGSVAPLAGADGGLAETAKTQAPTLEGAARAPEYLIKQESTRRHAGKQDKTDVSTWRIWFKGIDVLMPEWLGTEYLVFLIRQQGKEYDAGALTQAVRKSLPCGAAESSAHVSQILYGRDERLADGKRQQGRVGDLNERDVIWKPDQIQDALRKIERLSKDIGLHKKAGDLSSVAYQEAKEKLEEQQELLRNNAKVVNGKWAPKEYQKGTFKQQAELIGKHFRRLLNKHLRQNCRPLYEHLFDKAVLKHGVKNCYRPKPRIAWEFELKGVKKGT
jgi:hypothetical protein